MLQKQEGSEVFIKDKRGRKKIKMWCKRGKLTDSEHPCWMKPRTLLKPRWWWRIIIHSSVYSWIGGQAQAHVTKLTKLHQAWGRGSGLKTVEVGEKAGGNSLPGNEKFTHTHAFTFATLPQFYHQATPHVRKESSRFVVHITWNDQ